MINKEFIFLLTILIILSTNIVLAQTISQTTVQTRAVKVSLYDKCYSDCLIKNSCVQIQLADGVDRCAERDAKTKLYCEAECRKTYPEQPDSTTPIMSGSASSEQRPIEYKVREYPAVNATETTPQETKGYKINEDEFKISSVFERDIFCTQKCREPLINCSETNFVDCLKKSGNEVKSCTQLCPPIENACHKECAESSFFSCPQPGYSRGDCYKAVFSQINDCINNKCAANIAPDNKKIPDIKEGYKIEPNATTPSSQPAYPAQKSTESTARQEPIAMPMPGVSSKSSVQEPAEYTTQILNIIIKLEETKIALEQSALKLEAIGDYYADKNKEKSAVFKEASDNIKNLNNRLDSLKNDLKSNADNPKEIIVSLKNSVASIKYDLKQIVKKLVEKV